MKTRRFRRPAILCLLTCLFVTSVSLGAQGLYSDPDNYHLVSEWRVAVNPTAIREFQEVAFELQYGPPRWFARLRAGASVNAAGIPAALVGIEVPLLEADSENSNVRGWGLYLRGSQCLDSLGRPITEVGFGASASLFGLSGPGIVVAFGSDGLAKFSLTLTGAVGLK